MRNKEKEPVHGGDILGLLMEGKLLLIRKLHKQCGSGEGEPCGRFGAQQEQDAGTIRAHDGDAGLEPTVGRQLRQLRWKTLGSGICIVSHSDRTGLFPHVFFL